MLRWKWTQRLANFRFYIHIYRQREGERTTNYFAVDFFHEFICYLIGSPRKISILIFCFVSQIPNFVSAHLTCTLRPTWYPSSVSTELHYAAGRRRREGGGGERSFHLSHPQPMRFADKATTVGRLAGALSGGWLLVSCPQAVDGAHLQWALRASTYWYLETSDHGAWRKQEENMWKLQSMFFMLFPFVFRQSSIKKVDNFNLLSLALIRSIFTDSSRYSYIYISTKAGYCIFHAV